jgi:hypothetical protein
MKAKQGALILLLIGIWLVSPNVYSQSLRGAALNKLKKEAINKVLGTEQNEQQQPQADPYQDTETSGRPGQRAGSSKGLEKSSKDVSLSLNEAANAYSGSNYKKTRAGLTEALGNLDLMIGDKILQSFPSSVEGLAVLAENDQIASSSASWAGLIIKREYQLGDKWFSFSVMNSSLAAFANAAINTGMYTYSNQPSQKTVEIAGNQALITFDESSGYKINLSLGQQTQILIEGVNIASEAELTQMAKAFDYAFIKKMFGEN